MTRQEYNRRERALRKLLRAITADRRDRIIEYSFGAVIDPETQLWHVYNYNTNNCIGTVNLNPEVATMRYRPNSLYAITLKNFTYTEPTIHVPSTTLRARSRWLRDQLRVRVRDSFRRGQQNARVLSPRQVMRDTPTTNMFATIVQNGSNWRDSNGRLRDPRGRFVREAQEFTFNGEDWTARYNQINSALNQDILNYAEASRNSSFGIRVPRTIPSPQSVRPQGTVHRNMNRRDILEANQRATEIYPPEPEVAF